VWDVLRTKKEFCFNNVIFKVIAELILPCEPEMIFVKGGTFIMGSNTSKDDEKPAHEVTLTDFSIRFKKLNTCAELVEARFLKSVNYFLPFMKDAKKCLILLK